MSSAVILLGPQRLKPTVGAVVRSLRIKGVIATITAGWQERELEDDELAEQLRGRCVNLHLYARGGEVVRDDPELGIALRQRQALLRQLRELYRVRLAHALDAVRELRRRTADDGGLVEEARSSAMGAVRALDAEHIRRVVEVYDEFEERWEPGRRPAVARHREEIAGILEDTAAVAVAGGHVAVLLNRMRLFGIADMLEGRRVLAWSAGAMTLGQRVVLFHDSPPQGPGNAEVFEAGLGLYEGAIPFPHAQRRLRLDDPERVMLLTHRFPDDRCVAMVEGSRLEWRPRSGWKARSRIQTLSVDGSVGGMAG